jgi:hypothetical protein
MRSNIPPRAFGKTANRKRLDSIIKKNPNTVIVSFGNGEVRIEKPVKELGSLMIECPKKAELKR